MRGTWIVWLAAVIAAPVLGAQSTGLASASVAGRAGQLRALGAEYSAAYARFREALLLREQILTRGQGWKGADGGHGFQTPSNQAFFGPRSAGLTEFDADGKQISQFVISYQSATPLGIYTKADGTKLTAFYNGQTVANLEFTFPDGSRVLAWGPAIRVTYAGSAGAAFYVLADNRGQPMLSYSEPVAAAVRAGDGTVLGDLTADFPSDYGVRILTAAARAGVKLSDDKALAQFAVNWIRALAGASPVPLGAAMDRAATNHATYLVQNAVLPRLNALVATNPEIYLELHTEKPGTPGFTGEKIWDRTSAAGYVGYVTETANFGSATAVGDMVSWFHSVYHRRPFVDPRTSTYGYSRVVSTVRPGEVVGIANWTFGDPGSQAVVMYPADGETLVPTAWGAQEAPNPFPGRPTGTGLPLSVSIADPKYAGGTIELLDAAGSTVPLLQVTVRQDPNRYLEAAPDRPLERGATYTLRYTSAGGTITHTFTTAPPDPAQAILDEIRSALSGDTETRNPGFDVEVALKTGTTKGEILTASDGSGRITLAKFGLSLVPPEGWKVANRTWQELALAQGNATIGIQLYGLAPGANADAVLSTYAKSITYKAESTEPVRTDVVSGYRRIYGWQYAGKVILYGLVFGDFGVGIYGYGVTPELMQALVATFAPS